MGSVISVVIVSGIWGPLHEQNRPITTSDRTIRDVFFLLTLNPAESDDIKYLDKIIENWSLVIEQYEHIVISG